MIIAIIDDGINDFQINTPVDHYNLLVDCSNICEYSHGTVCAKLIETYGSATKFIDVKILDESGSGTFSNLISALEIVKGFKVDMINISNGIELFEICSKEYKCLSSLIKWHLNNGTKIYSAQSNTGHLTIPAMIKGVISVEQCSIRHNIRHSIYRTSSIYVNGSHIIHFNKKLFRSQATNSFACAFATARASKSKNNLINKFIKMLIVIHKTRFMFSLSGSEMKLNKRLKLKQHDIPIIILYAKHNTETQVNSAVLLHDSFANEGYTSIIMSDYKIAERDYPIYYFRNTSIANSYINESNIDIGIIILSKYIFEDDTWDLFIDLNDNSIVLSDGTKIGTSGVNNLKWIVKKLIIKEETIN